MIGLFGIWAVDRERPISLDAMSAVPDGNRYRVEAKSQPGVTVGGAFHLKGPAGSHAHRGDVDVLVCGEIFNGAELGSDGDAASVILKLYESRELDRLKDANGLFAAAICDRNVHRLTLVTDRFCSFPIHLHKASDRVAFAGQLAVLLAEGGVPRTASAAGLAQLFTLQRTVGRDTNIANVEALPAATICTVDSDGITERAYWKLTWKPSFQSEEDAAEALAGALKAAVARQTDHGADAPGLLLSGGLDSRMVLAAGSPGRLSCFTTASYLENPELAIARTLAEAHGRSFEPLIVAPESTLSVLDRTTLDSNGLYPASTQISVFMPSVGSACDVALTGHGLDYTFRGYYMPARFIRIAGSSTRLPSLRSVPGHPTGADVLSNLRQGPPKSTIDRIVLPERADFWWNSQAERLQTVLSPWLDSDEPLNAWDAFILHSLSKHYAFTGMMAIRAACNLRLTTYDRDVFDIYLGMPPAWRVRAGVALGAMRRLSPEMARLPNANTGFAADVGPWKEIFQVLGRAAGKRLRLIKAQPVPTRMHSAGSWQSLGALYREDPGHRSLFMSIRSRLDTLTFGYLSADGIAACIDEHMEGMRDHSKLLRYLMTHDSWIRQMGITGSD